MDRVTSIHPSHMYVAVTLPMLQQQRLRQALAAIHVPFETAKEYLRVQVHVFSDRAVPPSGPEGEAPGGPEGEPVRVTDSHILPPALHDMWPLVFSFLTAETACLSRRLRAAEARLERSVREARVASLVHLIHNQDAIEVHANEGLIAQILRGWEDLHCFMCRFLDADAETADYTHAWQFSSLARRMGLPGTLPPVQLRRPRTHDRQALADAGYAVA